VGGRSTAASDLNGTVSVYQVDPITDPRWSEFLDKQSQASIYHSPGWLEALSRTYDYEPLVLTTSVPGTPLENGIACCSVDSWVTGRRLVGVPFSDHCEPLISDQSQINEVVMYLQKEVDQNKWAYVELRPLSQNWNSPGRFREGQTFYFHQLDLTPSIESLLCSFDKDSVQRKIRRQGREELVVEEGRSERLLDYFYPLFIRTRRRHGLPPPPRRWFSNLMQLLGESITTRVCFKGTRAIASILTLQYKNMLTYKYGCSDERFHRLGGMQALFWNAIQNAKTAGLQTFDLGRTDRVNQGLLRFKDGWGTTSSKLTYLIYPDQRRQLSYLNDRMARRVFSLMPDVLLATVGKIMYRHVG